MVHTLVRTIRGMLGVGLTWGAVWGALGAALGLALGFLRPQDLDAGETPVRIGLILGAVGLVSGLGFALALSFLERGRTLLDVSLARVALWGAAGGAAVPLVTAVANSQVFWTVPLGAALAATTIAIARQAERRAALRGGSPPLDAGGVGQQLRSS